MKNTILALVFTVGTLPAGYALAQSTSTTEHSEQHSTKQVNPDGTAVHNEAASHERTDSTANPDGSSSTSRTKERRTRTKVKTNAPAPASASSTTEEHHSSTTTSTTTP